MLNFKDAHPTFFQMASTTRQYVAPVVNTIGLLAAMQSGGKLGAVVGTCVEPGGGTVAGYILGAAVGGGIYVAKDMLWDNMVHWALEAGEKMGIKRLDEFVETVQDVAFVGKMGHKAISLRESGTPSSHSSNRHHETTHSSSPVSQNQPPSRSFSFFNKTYFAYDQQQQRFEAKCHRDRRSLSRHCNLSTTIR